MKVKSLTKASVAG